MDENLTWTDPIIFAAYFVWGVGGGH